MAPRIFTLDGKPFVANEKGELFPAPVEVALPDPPPPPPPAALEPEPPQPAVLEHSENVPPKIVTGARAEDDPPPAPKSAEGSGPVLGRGRTLDSGNR